MQDQSIRDFFDQYASRIALYNRMAENMLHASSREIWQQAIHHAAAKVSDMYTVDAQYDLLLEQLMKFYALTDHDLFLIYELAKKLLPHFLTKGTTEQQIDVYTCLSYSNIELSRVVHEGYGKRSVEYYAKMISLGETMLGQDCPMVYRRMAVAYINMLITESALCNITMDDAKEYWLRLKSLRNGPKYAPFVESVQHATSLMDLTIERFATDAYGIYLNNNKQASPDKIMIDLITLSDCLDAATDNLGRNYQRAKKVSAVLEEFAAGSGTRYNPDLVHLLLTDAHLIARLCNLAGPERERISANAGAKM